MDSLFADLNQAREKFARGLNSLAGTRKERQDALDETDAELDRAVHAAVTELRLTYAEIATLIGEPTKNVGTRKERHRRRTEEKAATSKPKAKPKPKPKPKDDEDVDPPTPLDTGI